MSRLVCGFGVNDADYTVEVKETISAKGEKQRQKLLWRCPYYEVWKDMLVRCFSETFKNKYPTYNNCTVEEGWLTFSVFKSWMEQQDWKGKQLDKDLLAPSNKHYGPKTCIFVPCLVNNFILDNKIKEGKFPIGVSFHKHSGKLVAQCKQMDGKGKTLGYFDDPMQAHVAWLTEKTRLARILASMQDDVRVAESLVSRYENYHKYFTPYGVPIECQKK